MSKKRAKYTAIGFVVSNLVFPIVKKQVKKQAKQQARTAAENTRGALNRNPARTSIAVGSIIGALAWLITRSKSKRKDEQ